MTRFPERSTATPAGPPSLAELAGPPSPGKPAAAGGCGAGTVRGVGWSFPRGAVPAHDQGADCPGVLGGGGGDAGEVTAWRARAAHPPPGGAVPVLDQGLAAAGVAHSPGVGRGGGGHAQQDAAGRARAGHLLPCGAVPSHDQRRAVGPAAGCSDRPGAARAHAVAIPCTHAAGALAISRSAGCWSRSSTTGGPGLRPALAAAATACWACVSAPRCWGAAARPDRCPAAAGGSGPGYRSARGSVDRADQG